jgi:hypothetical protein
VGFLRPRIALAWTCTWVLLAPAAAAGAPVGEQPPELRLLAGPFRPLEAAPAPPAWLRDAAQAESAAGWRYAVAVADRPLEAWQRDELSAAGAAPLGYLPVHGYRLRLAPGAEERVRALPFVVWVGALPPQSKIRPEVTGRIDGPGDTAIRAVLHAGEPPERVLRALGGFRPRAAASGPEGAWRVEATVPGGVLAATLSRLAALPEVEAVEPVRPLRPLNQDGVWVHQSFVGPSPQETPIFDQGIFGCGQVIAVSDTGQDLDACQFADAVHGLPPVASCGGAPCPAATPDLAQRKDVLYYNWSGGVTGDDDFCPGILGGTGHGTHTSGSAAGDSAPYADCAGFTDPGRNGGDGQAPGAWLVLQEMGDGLEYLNSLGGSIWNLADVAYRTGARIHSFSWGGVCHDIFGTCVPGCTLPYDSLARDADVAMWTYPDLLIVASAGNANGLCPPPLAVSTPAIAKNLVSVGSVGHGGAAMTPTASSSPGPVFDGRLKPTLAAQGESVVSAGSDPLTAGNCDTCSLSGTSMSAPTVAGLAALVRDYYVGGFHAGGVRDPAQGIVPSGALLKATLVDGAVALGAAAPGPDFDSGFGRALLGETLAFAGGPFVLRVVDGPDGIGTGGAVVRAFDVSGGAPLRATLVWTDYPAALDAAEARVNELRLEAVDPAGQVWFQTLDPATGLPEQTASPAAPHDAVNVEERLVFPDPMPGRWIFRVRGVSVPWGPQPFALVVRGSLADCAAPPAPAAPPVLTTPGDAQVLVSWDPVPGAAAYNVYRAFGGCPGGAPVPVAAGVAGTSFLDATVSGGVTHGYVVVATSDAEAACESSPSPCAQVEAAGECLLAPQFAGVVSATADGLPTCSVTLAWDAATPFCAGDVRYNVYRDTTSGFTPGPGNRIARCVGGTSFVDAVDLSSGIDYHYVVRAEDDTSGHGGPCRGGNEEANTAEARVAPAGPPSIGTWTDDAGDTGQAKMLPGAPWGIAPTGGAAGPRVYKATSAGGVCADLTSPPITLASPGQGPQLFFATIHDLEFDGDIFGSASLGQVEVAAGPGFTNWTRVPVSYPTFVPFPYTSCPTTVNPTTYFTGPDLVYSTYSASLANWGGGEMKVRFHLSGDLLLAPGGRWWIDDIQVTKALVPGACAPGPAGPPPIPDGASVPGEPLRVERVGADLRLTWDATECPAAAVNVYYGALGDFTTFTGGHCGLPATGEAVLPFPDGVWLVVAATDGAATDGSWSRDRAGDELTYAGASAACPAITQHVTTNACP